MTHRGKKLAEERAFGRRDHDGHVRRMAESLRIERVRKWIFVGWTGPFNLIPRWKHVIVGYRYYDQNGRRVLMPRRMKDED